MGSPSLYQLSVRKVVQHFDKFSLMNIRPILTENMMFDIYWEMLFGNKTNDQIGSILRSDNIKTPLQRKMLQVLGVELAKLDTFKRLVIIQS